MRTISLLMIILSLIFPGCTKTSQKDLVAFENKLEKWRLRLKMPAFSASIVKNNEIIWAKGFGHTDIDNNVPATENTVYHLASLTKPFASIILMQLVEQGKVNLDDPVSKYGLDITEARNYGMDLATEDEIKVRHLLTHTAQGNPGSYYQYSGFLYGYLGEVIAKASGSSFAELLVKNITKPAQLNHTTPNIEDSLAFSYTGFDSATFAYQCASPYVMDSLYNIIEGNMESYFGASAGLMSSAIDMATFSIAVQKNDFLKPESWENVFSPTISTNGDTLPYGYGWFIQHYMGIKIIWHYGFWNTNSSLIMMVPEKEYSFIILANSNLLSRPFGLGGPDGNVFHSPFAIEFARFFLLKETLPEIDLKLSQEELRINIESNKNKISEDLMRLEVFALASAYSTVGDTEHSAKAYGLYNEFFTIPLPEKFKIENLITKISNVNDLIEESREFQLTGDTEVHIFSIGEGVGTVMYDYGWIENSTTGDTLWKMAIDKTIHAGGANKNRLVDTTIDIKAGSYKLHFKSDDSHSFNRWNSTPPDFAFYGIALYKRL